MNLINLINFLFLFFLFSRLRCFFRSYIRCCRGRSCRKSVSARYPMAGICDEQARQINGVPGFYNSQRGYLNDIKFVSGLLNFSGYLGRSLYLWVHWGSAPAVETEELTYAALRCPT